MFRRLLPFLVLLVLLPAALFPRAGSASGPAASLSLKFPQEVPFGSGTGKLLRVSEGPGESMPLRLDGPVLKSAPGFYPEGRMLTVLCGPASAGRALTGPGGASVRLSRLPAGEVSVVESDPSALKVVKVAAGDYHSLALLSDGRVLAWGRNLYGELGNGTLNYSKVPAFVRAGAGPSNAEGHLVGVVDIAAGMDHSLALLSDGRVLAWGRNNAGQLGIGVADTASHALPAFVKGVGNSGELWGVVQISTSSWSYHNLALLSDGRCVSWGSNYRGALGDPSFSDINRPYPGEVSSARGVVQVVAGYIYNLALMPDGRVLAWGRNCFGQLGNGAEDDLSHPNPAFVRNPDNTGELSGVVQVDTGCDTSYALLRDGGVLAWGWNGALGNSGGYYGMLGFGDGVPNNKEQTVPGPVKGVGGSGYLSDVPSLCGWGAALLSDGRLVSWGYGNWGRLGSGFTDDRGFPDYVVGLNDVLCASLGSHHGLAVLRDGRLLSWGYNAQGQLGDGTTVDKLTPVQMTVP